jgi:ribonucleoside-triphosphate reductase
MTEHFDTRALLAESKFLESYARINEKTGTYETWDEAVDRVMGMHKTKYVEKMSPELSSLIEEASESYKRKAFLGSQRALQFGGDQILSKNARIYNCTASYADRKRFFGEIFWLLLCGCGTGFSVQNRHVDKLPEVIGPNRTLRGFNHHVAEDSIEGWADAAQALMDTYFEGRLDIIFDFSKIRPKGAFISGGFKAPGPEPLERALNKIRPILDGAIGRKLKTIEVYDIVMHLSDAVLSGGVRRAATICLFSKEDQDMMKAKTGNWFVENPQRGRSNNSVALIRSETTQEEFDEIMNSVKEFGEPGSSTIQTSFSTLALKSASMPTTNRAKAAGRDATFARFPARIATRKKSSLRLAALLQSSEPFRLVILNLAILERCRRKSLSAKLFLVSQSLAS